MGVVFSLLPFISGIRISDSVCLECVWIFMLGLSMEARTNKWALGLRRERARLDISQLFAHLRTINFFVVFFLASLL